MFPMGYLPKASDKIETSMEVCVDWGGVGLEYSVSQSHSDSIHDTRINCALKIGAPGTTQLTKQK